MPRAHHDSCAETKTLAWEILRRECRKMAMVSRKEFLLVCASVGHVHVKKNMQTT